MNLRAYSSDPIFARLWMPARSRFVLPPVGKPTCETAQPNRTFIFLPGRFQDPDSLQVHQLETELRPVESVNASAKLTLICGFHKGWCINQITLPFFAYEYLLTRFRAPVFHCKPLKNSLQRPQLTLAAATRSHDLQLPSS